MTKKAILLLIAALLTLAALAIPAMAGGIPDDHSNLFVAIYPQANVICMNERYELRFCNICQVFVDANTYPPLGHKWGEWTVTSKPTCDTDGVETRACTGYHCTEAQTKAINKLGGTCQWVQDIMVTYPATCTDRAYQMKKCSVCGTTAKQPLDGVANNPLGHDFKPVEKTADTNTANGYQSQACKRCPVVEKTYEHSAAQCGAANPAASTLPAVWKWINDVTVAPTCTTDGSETKECNVCGRKVSTVKPKAHTWGTGDTSAHKCNICNALELHSWVKDDATNHKCTACARQGTHAGNWVKDDATNHKCSVCDQKEKHEGKWVIDDPTNHKCSVCDQKEKHEGKWMILDPMNHKCSVCGALEIHKWVKDNASRHKCSVCDEKENHAAFWVQDDLINHKCMRCEEKEKHNWSGADPVKHACMICMQDENHQWDYDKPVVGKKTCKVCQKEDLMP